MDLNHYRVDMDFCYEKDGIPNRSSGYQNVYAGSKESARLVAKARARGELKKQGCKIIFMDFKDPVKID